jgi:hypothetical protein
MSTRSSFSSGRFFVAVAAVLAIVLAAGFIALQFFDVQFFDVRF